MYYELLRHIRIKTTTDYQQEVDLVQFPDLFDPNLKDPKTLLPYLALLRGNLLDPSLSGCIDACERFQIALQQPVINAQTSEQLTLVYQLIGIFNFENRNDGINDVNGVAFRVKKLNGLFVELSNADYHGNHAKFDEPSRYETDPAVRIITSNIFKSYYTYSFQLSFKNPEKWDDLSFVEVAAAIAESTYNFNIQAIVIQGITNAGVIDLGGWSQEVQLVKSGDNEYETNTVIVGLNRPKMPPVVAPDPMQRLSEEDQQCVWRLYTHVQEYMGYYSRLKWTLNDEERIEQLKLLGNAFQSTYWPIASFGRYLVFPKLVSTKVTIDQSVLDERLITLSTRGVFADAKLGCCNVSEKIDNTRFWDWQQSPIPFKAPDIIGVQPQSYNQPVTELQPTTLPTPVVGMQTAPAEPDPSTAAALKALTTPDIFRDMSVAKEVAGVITEVTKAATQVAIAAGNMLKPATGTQGTKESSNTGSNSGQQNSGPGSSTGNTGSNVPVTGNTGQSSTSVGSPNPGASNTGQSQSSGNTGITPAIPILTTKASASNSGMFNLTASGANLNIGYEITSVLVGCAYAQGFGTADAQVHFASDTTPDDARITIMVRAYTKPGTPILGENHTLGTWMYYFLPNSQQPLTPPLSKLSHLIANVPMATITITLSGEVSSAVELSAAIKMLLAGNESDFIDSVTATLELAYAGKFTVGEKLNAGTVLPVTVPDPTKSNVLTFTYNWK